MIDFYIQNGLEFDKNKGYFGNNIKSFVLVEKEKIIGAVTISNYKNTSFIEALAVDMKHRRKRYGKKLLEKAISELSKPIYTISKDNKFYIDNGFVYDSADLIDKECKTCKEYNVSCFPKVLVYK